MRTSGLADFFQLALSLRFRFSNQAEETVADHPLALNSKTAALNEVINNRKPYRKKNDLFMTARLVRFEAGVTSRQKRRSTTISFSCADDFEMYHESASAFPDSHLCADGSAGACNIGGMQNNNQSDRRAFLKSSLIGGIALSTGITVLGSFPSTANAADSKDEVSMPGAAKLVTSEELFRKGLRGPVELSLAVCKIAVDKATNANTKEFAGFELTEAISVAAVLEDLGTPVPTMTDDAKATLEKMQSLPRGAEFDKAFIKAQLENHEFLRDHAAGYLKETADKSSAAEKQGHHLAMLALATFKEHVMICQRIAGELKA